MTQPELEPLATVAAEGGPEVRAALTALRALIRQAILANLSPDRKAGL